MDIDKILLILDQVERLGIGYKKIMADGKVGVDDLPAAIGLLSDVQGFIEAFKGAKEALEEAKDLDAVEGVELVKKLYNVGKAIEQA